MESSDYKLSVLRACSCLSKWRRETKANCATHLTHQRRTHLVHLLTAPRYKLTAVKRRLTLHMAMSTTNYYNNMNSMSTSWQRQRQMVSVTKVVDQYGGHTPQCARTPISGRSLQTVWMCRKHCWLYSMPLYTFLVENHNNKTVVLHHHSGGNQHVSTRCTELLYHNLHESNGLYYFQEPLLWGRHFFWGPPHSSSFIFC